jgi:tetratricopeptide (TPR) repeat protein
LDEDLQPLMNLIGLHEAYFDADYLEAMTKQVDPEWTRQRIDRLAAALGAAGLVRDIGQATCEMHPLLTSYLRSRGGAESSQRAFVDFMARLADQLAPRPHHEQRVPFLLHGANFHFALHLSHRLAMDEHFGALTQSLAAYALHSRNFVEASRLFAELAQHCVGTEHSEGEASAYHQLGMIAEEQREFETAREWYLKSLAISEKQGNLHGAPSTYGQLGILAGLQGSVEESGKWLAQSIAGFLQMDDQYMAERAVGNFLVLHQRASAEDKRKLEAIWRNAGLGPFPGDPKQ